jgi:acid phosphatase (class A)
MKQNGNIIISFVIVALFLGGMFFLMETPPQTPTGMAENDGAPRGILDPFFSLSGASVEEKNAKDKLAFSNTAVWDKELLKHTKTKTIFLPHMEDMIRIPPPPKSSSERVQKELELLLSYKNLRTPERMKKIESEILPETTDFGGRLLTDYYDPKQFPLTAPLLTKATNDIVPVIFILKQRYDRVRPGALELDISPAIDVPGHPAYPSGHSTIMHLTAYLLSELAPERREEFGARAREIAIDREIAGLHYPSDTLAGSMVARQFVDILLGDTEFRRAMTEAQAEWR